MLQRFLSSWRFGAAVASLALVFVSTPAVADPSHVLVAGEDGDQVADRLVRELAELGFIALRIDSASSCDRKRVVELLEQEQTTAAVCSNEEGVFVWSAGRLEDFVPRRAPDLDSGAVAVRAAEIVRAHLANQRAADADVAAGDPHDVSVFDGLPPPLLGADDGAFDTLHAARRVIATAFEPTRDEDLRNEELPVVSKADWRTESISLGLGVGSLAGLDTHVPTLSGMLAFGASRYLAPFARVDMPLDVDRSTTTYGSVAVSPGLVAVGVQLPLASPTHTLIPRVGAGVGAAWLSVSSIPGSFPVPSGSTMSDGSSFGASPMALLDGALSARIAGPLRLCADASLGATSARLVARGLGKNVAYWGQPFAAVALRAELSVP